MKKRAVSLVVLMALLLTMLAGCSSGSKEESSSASLQIVLVSKYVAEDHTNALTEELNKALPQLNNDTAKLKVTGISAGDSESDPYGTMAAVTQMAGMMASKEVELIICDADTARRYAENGEAYVPLADLFTEAEIAELGLTPAYVALSDDEGNLTGEMSGACGVDLSECAALEQTLKLTDLGAYVLVDSANQENAKAVIRHLAGMK